MPKWDKNIMTAPIPSNNPLHDREKMITMVVLIKTKFLTFQMKNHQFELLPMLLKRVKNGQPQ